MRDHKNNIDYHNYHSWGHFHDFNMELLFDISKEILSTFNIHLTHETLVYEINLTKQSINDVFDILDNYEGKSFKEYYTILNVSSKTATIIFNKVIFNINEQYSQ